MITSQVVAEVRRVLRGHSDRALVHAVDGDGLEYKIEVPLDQVRALSDQQGHVLTISYAIHTLPGLAPPAADLEEAGSSAAGGTSSGDGSTAAGEAMGTADPAAVDAEFMGLMSRRSGSSTSSTSSTPSTPAGAPFGAPSSPQTGASSAEALASRSAGPSRPVTTTAPGAEADPLADILGDLR